MVNVVKIMKHQDGSAQYVMKHIAINAINHHYSEINVKKKNNLNINFLI